MRHDGCGDRAEETELLTGIEGVSGRPVVKIAARMTTVSARMGTFLANHAGERFCEECLVREMPLRHSEQARRAAGVLAARTAYRIEDDADCSRCDRIRQTIRTLRAWL
jgi:hypothetical protein